MKEKITHCPIKYCPDFEKEFTPEELCDHFALKEVEPFWYTGWVRLVPEPEPEIEIESEPEIEIKEESLGFGKPGICVICMDQPCDSLLIPCGHVNSCSSCLKNWNKGCPSCRQPTKKTLPISPLSIESLTEHAVFFVGLEE